MHISAEHLTARSNGDEQPAVFQGLLDIGIERTDEIGGSTVYIGACEYPVNGMDFAISMARQVPLQQLRGGSAG
ncbi:hypothetical protein [Acidihalobacter ferrooxydans]|uniref:hypothetical protein n=1 Tax=Acidihalobacter ferrooxydans TaxID=1765967 RepID=UPI0018DD3B95|nr:hypothetical protein [Acidihalobacter ferrooxydans]